MAGALLEAGLPERVTHNDTKLNNVLLDERTGERICVIDLDTVMPGLAAYDFGDMVRTMTCPAAEDERDLARVEMRFSFFEAVLRGYLAGAGSFLTAGRARVADYRSEGDCVRAGGSFSGGSSCRGYVLQGEQGGAESGPVQDTVQAAGVD